MSLSRVASIAAALPFVAGPCRGQDDDLRAKIQDALELARPALLAHLHAAHTSATRAGELALLCLAALHDGVPADDATLAKALKRLAKADADQTYDLALRLMVLEACPTFPDRDDVAADDTKTLLRHRSDEGAFQYYKGPSSWDLSNTQYGALGLRAAAATGQKIRDEVWRTLAREVGASQMQNGGFGYAPRRADNDGYASMTAAGIAVLAICRQALGGDGHLARRLDEQIEKGWQWFAGNAAVLGSPKERWSYYFHYGLERAAILCDVERIGDQHDWYALGARMLVDAQLPGGGWHSTTDGFPGHRLDRQRGDAVPTAFAILFLRRKFQKNAGPITPHVVTLAAVGPKSKPTDVDACADWLIGRGKQAMGDVVKGLRSDIEPQRRAAAKALRAIVGDDFGYDPARGRDDNTAAVRSAELWYLKNR